MITWEKDTSQYCCYCGKEFSGTLVCTKDHVIPKSKGGSGKPANIRNCCHQCNHDKGNLFLEEYLEKVQRGRRESKKLSIKVENILHLIEYVKIKGECLFKDHYSWSYYSRRYPTLSDSSTVEPHSDKVEVVGSNPARTTCKEYEDFY